MSDVVGISDISRNHHLTGSHREIQTPQNSCENLEKRKGGKSYIQCLNTRLFLNSSQAHDIELLNR